MSNSFLNLKGELIMITKTIKYTDYNGVEREETLSIIQYIKPTCNLNVEAPSTDGVLNFSVTGNYFNSSFGATSNSLVVEYRK